MALSVQDYLARLPDLKPWANHGALPTFDELHDLTQQHGIDVATAVAFDAVARHEKHHAFVDEVDRERSQPSQVQASGNCGVAFVPNLGFVLDSKSRDVGRRIANAAESLGLAVVEIGTDPTSALAQNGAAICDALLAMPFDRIVVVSLSKGSADVKIALEQPAAREAFSRVSAWLNVCGLLDGSPVVNWLLANEQAAEDQLLQWFHRLEPQQVKKILAACRECGRGLMSQLARELELPPHIQMFSVIAFPTSDTLSYDHTRVFHSLMSADGPNDGFGLIADQISTPGVIYPVWGADHYIDRFLDVEALALALFGIIVQRCGLSATTILRSRPQGAVGILDTACGSPTRKASISRQKDSTDHERLRHARQRDKGFAVGRYLQPPPMLFTRDGHNLFLGDMYRGGCAFLAGAGPSLGELPLTGLLDRGVLTCAMNNAATVFRPNLWVSVDDPGNFADAIWRDPGILKFVPLCHMEKPFTVRDARNELVPSTEAVGDMPAVFGYRRNEEFIPEQWLYEDTFNWGNHSHQVDALGNKGSRSVMYVALRLLFYLGVRQVFLIGCDFRMEFGKRNYAFEQDRTRSSVRGNNSSYEILNHRLAALVPHFKREGFDVWNCTPHSGLTVFPYLDFNEAHRWACSTVPQRINTAGMYDRQRRERERTHEQQPNCDSRREPSPEIATGATKPVPELTLVVAIDERSLEKLRLTWPTWMHFKRELRGWPVLMVHDSSVDPKGDKCALLREHANLRFVPWSMPDEVDQREKMLTALVRIPATEVQTPWYLKLDVDVVATDPGPWIEPTWFQEDDKGCVPVFVSSPWGYTKPADALARLDTWGDGVPALSGTPRLDLPFDCNAECIAHPRIISWCFFGNTSWTREMSALAPGRLPCPSQDTFLYYCAARRGDRFIRTRMTHYGWKHVAASVRRLKHECELAMRRTSDVQGHPVIAR
jgi:hypothetical protein